MKVLEQLVNIIQKAQPERKNSFFDAFLSVSASLREPNLFFSSINAISKIQEIREIT